MAKTAFYMRQYRANAGGVVKKIENSVETIRNAKKENLMVFDDKGNLVYAEGGQFSHTGYGSVDYTGKIAVHNHPKGTYPFPSDTDCDTFEKRGCKEMWIVSNEYTVRLREDPNYTNAGREGITYAKHLMGLDFQENSLRRDLQSGKITRQQYIDGVFDVYKRAAKRSGYILEAKKQK